MLEFLLITVLLVIIVSFTSKSNIFFNYIRIKVKVIGFDIEIKSKEKSTQSHKDQC